MLFRKISATKSRDGDLTRYTNFVRVKGIQMNKARLPVWTFLAMLAVVILVGFLAVPSIVKVTQDIYVRLQADHNIRISRGLAQFIENRVEAGIDKAEIIREVQAITA
ncbi:hypothetical protein C2W62_50620, partial [Candidatus Entotheonella serta]